MINFLLFLFFVSVICHFAFGPVCVMVYIGKVNRINVAHLENGFHQHFCDLAALV